MTVWLIVPDNGYEGLAEPLAAYWSEADAMKASDLIRKAYGQSHRVVSIQVEGAPQQ